MSVPGFFLGILITYVFGLVLKWFTPGAYVSPSENFGGFLSYLIAPSIAIALPKSAMAVKMLRSSVITHFIWIMCALLTAAETGQGVSSAGMC